MTHTTELICLLPLDHVAHVTYRNHRGETAVRKIAPLAIHYGSTEYHPEPQHLLAVIDLDKRNVRMFALRNVLKWHGEGLDPLVVRLIEEHSRRIAAEAEVKRLQALTQTLSREYHTDTPSQGTVRFALVPEGDATS